MLRILLAGALLSLLALPSSALAQTGRVTGTVVDASNGDPLPGANVVVRGTTIGAAADLDGTFAILGAPAGEQTLVVSYVGYDNQEIPVQVVAGGTVEVEIEMTWVGVVGDEIEITAQARGQNQAINEQLSARTIVNVVSAERIRELPDESAATALSRLPGVSLQDGDKVVIRGIQAKMNTIMVNGIQLPSTDLENRSTSLGFISSNMLAGIEVSKAVTPAMDANSIGGVVNLRLREAPVGLHFDTMLQGDYNTQDRTYQNYRMWASVSNRFLADRLGVFVQGNARRFDGGLDFANSTYDPMGPGQDAGWGQRTYGMNQYAFSDQVNIREEYGGSIMLDYRLPNGKLVLQNTYASETNDNTTHTDRLLLNNRQRDFRLERDINDRYLLVNALQGEHYVAGLNVDWGLSHARSQKDTDLRYAIEFNPTVAFDPISEDRRMTFTPDSVFSIVLNEEHWANASAGNGSTRDEHFSERRLAATLNVELPVAFTNTISGSFQAGGKFEQLSRENDVTRYFARLSEPSNNALAADYLRNLGINPDIALRFIDFRDPDYERGEYFLGDRRAMSDVVNTEYMDGYMRLAPPGWGQAHAADSRRFDYLADESITAGYLMADFNLGSRLNVLTGVRYENFHMDYSAPYVYQNHFDGGGDVPDTLDVDRSVAHWFPNLQLQYHVTDWFDVRAAYTKTLSRPDYQQLLPSTFVDVGNSPPAGTAGNPYLNPTVSQNYDMYLSFHHNRIGLFTVGGFIKDLEDVILQQRIMRQNLEGYEGVVWVPSLQSCPGYPNDACPDLPPSGIVSTFLNNQYPATIRGLEFDWQTNFWYLPRPFNSLVFNINYTRVHSEMEYFTIRTVRRGLSTVQEDTVRTARLLQQGDNVLNMALGADVGGFSGRISFRFQGDVVTNLSAERPELDAFREDVYVWDFSLSQRLPIEGLTVFFNGLNIGHRPENDYAYFRNEAEGEPRANISRIAYNPRRFQLGIRYNI